MSNLNTNIVATKTIINKEVARFLRIWPQTLLPSAVTQSLYFLIFGSFIGSQLSNINGVSYMQFIVPGLIMMAVITNSFSNAASSFFGSKFQRSVEELIVSPISNWSIIAGYVFGAALRGVLIGFIVFSVSFFFTRIPVQNPIVVLTFVVITALTFASAGLLNGIFAKKFDHVSIVPTFVLTPLTYLGGVFYSIDRLPDFWRNISNFNPIIYMVDGFRFGFFGTSNINPWFSFNLLIIILLVLLLASWYLLKKGTGIKS